MNIKRCRWGGKVQTEIAERKVPMVDPEKDLNAQNHEDHSQPEVESVTINISIDPIKADQVQVVSYVIEPAYSGNPNPTTDQVSNFTFDYTPVLGGMYA